MFLIYSLNSLVPHPIYPSQPEVCLIVPDLFRGRRTDAAFAQYKETYEARLQSTGVTGINALLPFTQMRYEYRPYELKRKLVDSYDVFLCDGRIFHHCSKFFGKFMDKPFIPIHAILRDEEKKVKFSKHLQTEVDKALRRVTLTVTPYGSSFSVRHVGHSGLTTQELADNIEAVWKSLSDILPGGIGNIKAVYVKGSLTLPIPLYAAFVPPKEVPVGKFRQIPAPVEDELSTVPGRNVIVYPDGKIWYQDTQTEEDKEFIQVMVKNKTKVAKTEDSTVKLDVDGENAEDDAGDAAGDAVGAQTERLDKQKQTAAKGSDEDTDDEYDDIAAAEEEYLQNWSESISMKQLEEEEVSVCAFIIFMSQVFLCLSYIAVSFFFFCRSQRKINRRG
ncbi:hypothetical protein ONE63_008817 [Megalurothrips usitatus]|uniref:Uncharacterized protein n=1 Tax=Megalurothrips usitatus TaxID=439358 RepID=A0AAV7XR03_9NEOP|nr:hypothetical protein ONE63_008817 [Megalurothrips usitatus]